MNVNNIPPLNIPLELDVLLDQVPDLFDGYITPARRAWNIPENNLLKISKSGKSHRSQNKYYIDAKEIFSIYKFPIIFEEYSNETIINISLKFNEFNFGIKELPKDVNNIIRDFLKIDINIKLSCDIKNQIIPFNPFSWKINNMNEISNTNIYKTLFWGIIRENESISKNWHISRTVHISLIDILNRIQQDIKGIILFDKNLKSKQYINTNNYIRSDYNKIVNVCKNQINELFDTIDDIDTMYYLEKDVINYILKRYKKKYLEDKFTYKELLEIFNNSEYKTIYNYYTNLFPNLNNTDYIFKNKNILLQDFTLSLLRKRYIKCNLNLCNRLTKFYSHLDYFNNKNKKRKYYFD